MSFSVYRGAYVRHRREVASRVNPFNVMLAPLRVERLRRFGAGTANDSDSRKE
ncbi:MAG: hypothetical protein MAG453_00847 [Calditrichaeota bacterium]|nr:hypothetical protein [Calditrichota bacterium]